MPSRYGGYPKLAGRDYTCLNAREINVLLRVGKLDCEFLWGKPLDTDCF